ncbi:MAG: hypothetical protein K2Q21_11760 [Chitinophagaceae bacterium]|nr:hypothetical protein [Chitinophagaceae bacterium]
MVNSLVQWLSVAIISIFHPFYVSVVDINQNVKEATVEVSIRIFTPDLEQTLQKYSSSKVDIAHPADKQLLEKQISNYINQKLQLKINNQAVTMQYVGHEIQMESVWIYFEIPKITQLKKLDINCNLLYDFQNLQSNIFHVKANGNEKSYKLDFPKTSTSFEF